MGKIVPFAELTGWLSDSLRDRLVLDALRASESESDDAAVTLRRLVRKNVRIPGYHRNPLKAPAPLLATSVADVFMHVDAGIKALLQVWMASQTGLRDKVTRYLESEGRDLPADPLGSDGFLSATTAAELENMTARFIENHPDSDRGQVALMLCCVTSSVPVPEDRIAEYASPESEEGESSLAPRWRAWLDELESLDPMHPDWRSFPAFLQRLMTVADSLQTKLTDLMRQELTERLEDLVREHAETLAFFGLASAQDWSARLCPEDDLSDALKRVKELIGLLERYEQAKQSQPKTVEEARLHRQEMDQIEHEVEELAFRLREALCGETEPGEGAEPDLKDLSGDTTQPVADLAGEEAGEEADQGDTERDGLTAKTADQTHKEEAPLVTPVAEPTPCSPEPSDAEADRQRYEPSGAEGETVEAIEAASTLVGAASVSAEKPTVDMLQERETRETMRLLASPAAARAARDNPSRPNWEALIWSLIAEDDIAGAYWIARSFECEGRESPVPSWLPRALVGSRLLSAEVDAFVIDLFEVVRDHTDPPADPAQRLLCLAAALKPALLKPATGMGEWLQAPDGYSRLQSLTRVMADFARLGILVHPRDFIRSEGQRDIDELIQAVAHDAGDWLARIAPARRTSLFRANRVWREMIRTDGEVEKLLRYVVSDDHSQVEQVRQAVRQLGDDGYVRRIIGELDQRLTLRRPRPITSAALQHLLNNVSDAVRWAARWCELVDRKGQLAAQGTWRAENLSAFRARLADELSQAKAELDEKGRSDAETCLQAATQCLSRSLSELSTLVGLGDVFDIKPVPDGAVPALGARQLDRALERRLLWVPSVERDDSGTPTPSALHTIGEQLCTSIADERSIAEACELWLQREDYRFVTDLLWLASDESADLEDRQAAARQQSRARLRAHIEEANAIDPNLVESFGPRYAELRNLRSSLGEARRRRLAELSTQWDDLKGRLNELNIGEGEKVQVRDAVEAALTDGDTRVVDEGLAQLRRALDLGERLDVSLFSPREEPSSVEEFVEKAETIQAWLEREQGLGSITGAIRGGRTRAGIAFGLVPQKRRDEGILAIEAWLQLKRQRGAGRIELHTATLMEYLGFRVAPDDIRVMAADREWVHLQASMSDNGLAKPIPQFGTGSHGRYDILCVWDSPGPETVVSLLTELRIDGQTAIILYVGRLTTQQRRYLTIKCREANLGLAVLDETLLVFLSKERDTRLPVFLRCALPFSSLNPYTPFQAGDVPPEMFFGRSQMIAELERPSGSCIVYGGRQLGKSALLRQVMRRFHDPDRRQHARVLNLKLIFDPESGKGTDSVLWALRDTLKELGILSKRVSSDQREVIARHIRVAMENNRDVRVLIMFDEADEFLDHDAQDHFPVVSALRQMMEDSGRRLKVCFAGLHSVQRFQNIPNQPLAHFGAPICVGPLEPDAARQLVRQPLDTLGYRFEDDAAFLRILSYTNYHPGLIQLFCQELLNNLRHRDDYRPPYTISRDDVQAAYGSQEVRDRIRERFEWTLALDARYQAIVWAMIADQVEAKDSYAREYPMSEIREMVSGWWPTAFAGQAGDEIAGLVNELCGLGILVRTGRGCYRLRSPNLVRLMGTESDIEDRLLELTVRPPSRPRIDQLHRMLHRGQMASPLTYAQERDIGQQASGVGLVMGSAAGGLDALPAALHALRMEGQEHADVPPSLSAEFCPAILPGPWIAAATCDGGASSYRQRSMTPTTWPPWSSVLSTSVAHSTRESTGFSCLSSWGPRLLGFGSSFLATGARKSRIACGRMSTCDAGRWLASAGFWRRGRCWLTHERVMRCSALREGGTYFSPRSSSGAAVATIPEALPAMRRRSCRIPNLSFEIASLLLSASPFRIRCGVWPSTSRAGRIRLFRATSQGCVPTRV